MKEVLIIYASLTGNTAACADIITEELEKQGLTVDIFEAMEADPEDLNHYSNILIGSYTYGDDGDIPDEMLDYYEAIGDMDLTGKVFGTFGSGDDFYPKFATAVDDFADRLTEAGARQAGPGVKVNLYPDTEEDMAQLQALAQALAKVAQ